MVKIAYSIKDVNTALHLFRCMFGSVHASCTDISSDENFLLAISETFNNSCSLLNHHFPTEERHLVALFRQLAGKPVGSFSSLGKDDNMK